MVQGIHMEYMGRKIKAYRLENTTFIVIDVLQKEGDCPNNFDEKHRYTCSLDCGNSFMIFSYDFMNDVIEGEGALNKCTWSYDLEKLVKFGFNPKIMTNIIGYFDKFGPAQKQIITRKHIKNLLNVRETRFTMDFPDKFKQMLPLVKEIDDCYKLYAPEY